MVFRRARVVVRFLVHLAVFFIKMARWEAVFHLQCMINYARRKVSSVGVEHSRTNICTQIYCERFLSCCAFSCSGSPYYSRSVLQWHQRSAESTDKLCSSGRRCLVVLNHHASPCTDSFMTFACCRL